MVVGARLFGSAKLAGQISMSESVFHLNGDLDLTEESADRNVKSRPGVRDVDGSFNFVLSGNVLGSIRDESARL